MDPLQALVLAVLGLFAGVVNTLAGGGSLLTVPVLVLLGLPGNLANGTNRVGILLQSVAAGWRFHRAGVSGLREAWGVVLPVVLGSVLGATLISAVSDRTFERLFAIVMLVLLVPTLRPAPGLRAPRKLPRAVHGVLFFVVGLYGGAFQAGVGLLLVFALSSLGYDLVRANSIKVLVIAVLTAVAVPVFVWRGQVAWLPALVLGSGFTAGGFLGAKLAVERGERIVRPVLAGSVLALAAKMLGLF
ncbi:MAG: UPF0721 transmembrane protein [Candidatus Binatia bacterium]|nr:MAG: UPF0721 transmembrane protein [Candidatus Binatia bacterium]